MENKILNEDELIAEMEEQRKELQKRLKEFVKNGGDMKVLNTIEKNLKRYWEKHRDEEDI